MEFKIRVMIGFSVKKKIKKILPKYEFESKGLFSPILPEKKLEKIRKNEKK